METEDCYFFWKNEFSQWTLRDMVDENFGVRYNCCEQYMMNRKAFLFRDLETSEKIMSEIDPRKQQRLGREVKGFDKEIWEANRIRIVYHGNLMKFKQYGDLRKQLLDTYPKLLVEASPDMIWGCGLNEDSPLIKNIQNWRGMNLLGATLTCVRNDIIDGRTKV